MIRKEGPRAQRVGLDVESCHNFLVRQVVCKHVPKVVVVWTPRVVWVDEAAMGKRGRWAVSTAAGGAKVVHPPGRLAARCGLVRGDDPVHVARDAVIGDVLVVGLRNEALAHGELKVEVQVPGEGLSLVVSAGVSHTKAKEVEVEGVPGGVHEVGQGGDVHAGVRLPPDHEVPAPELRELVLDKVLEGKEVQVRRGRVVVLAGLPVQHRLAVGEPHARGRLEEEHVRDLVPPKRVWHQTLLAVHDVGS
mmetsp:Transcript_1272/g.4836  ORF Transcript_1272/g.4836 Transcript_1272/m.4836 type:complete len:248 (-) Transcript_1272:354-1097(-)